MFGVWGLRTGESYTLPRVNAWLAAILVVLFATSVDATNFPRLSGQAALNITLFSAVCDVHVVRRPGQLRANTFKIFVLNTGKLPLPAGTKLKVTADNFMLFSAFELRADLAPGAEVETYTLQGPNAQPKNYTVTKV